MSFVIPFDGRTQIGAGINEDVIAPTERVAIEQQRSLVDAVDDAIGWDSFLGTGQLRKRSEKVGFVNDVPDQLVFLNHSGSPSSRGSPGGPADSPVSFAIGNFGFQVESR